MPTIRYNINSDLEDWNINRNYRKDKDKFIYLYTNNLIDESITFNDGTELYIDDDQNDLQMALKNNIFYLGSFFNFTLAGNREGYQKYKKLVEISSKYN
jgi:hypothetical protein